MLGPFRCSVVCGAAVSGSMMQCGAGRVAGEVKIQSDWSSNKVKPTLGQSGKVSLACDVSPSPTEAVFMVHLTPHRFMIGLFPLSIMIDIHLL